MIAHVGNLQGNDVTVGSVILSVNQMNVASVADLKKELKKLSQSEAVQKNKEVVLYIYDPQSRRYDYIAMDFNSIAAGSASPKRRPVVNKVILPKKNDKSLVEKLKEGLKTQWRLI
jgi:hypothetical protein